MLFERYHNNGLNPVYQTKIGAGLWHAPERWGIWAFPKGFGDSYYYQHQILWAANEKRYNDDADDRYFKAQQRRLRRVFEYKDSLYANIDSKGHLTRHPDGTFGDFSRWVLYPDAKSFQKALRKHMAGKKPWDDIPIECFIPTRKQLNG